jgi:hypothetical protein
MEGHESEVIQQPGLKWLSRPIAFSVARVKPKGIGKCLPAQRAELLRAGPWCAKCNGIEELEVDHKIPVALAGPIFELQNLQLLCLDCHRAKTVIDHQIIASVKTLRWLRQVTQTEYLSFVPIKFLHFFYEKWFEICLEVEALRKRYFDQDIGALRYSENRLSDPREGSA